MRHQIVGTGRWGTWLAKRMVSQGLELASVANRTEATALALARSLDTEHQYFDDIHQSYLAEDVVWLCVRDDAIAGLLAGFGESPQQPLAIIHCSGTVPISRLPCNNAVVWPLQSISEHRDPDWQSLPLIVQAPDSAFAKTLLTELTRLVATPLTLIASNEQRSALHLGAVLTQNFSNALWAAAAELLAPHGFGHELLLPLAQTHLLALAETIDPRFLQSGPSVRNDTTTEQRQLEHLADSPQLQELYKQFAALIRAQQNRD